MKINQYLFVTKLDDWQQEAFNRMLEEYKDDKDIVFGIKTSLAVLGYEVIEAEKKGVD